jgi:hypothetical protein
MRTATCDSLGLAGVKQLVEHSGSGRKIVCLLFEQRKELLFLR